MIPAPMVAGAYVFIMDPIERINVEGDSTLVMMLEAQRRGHPVVFALVSGLEQVGAAAYIQGWTVEVRKKRGDHFTLGPPVRFHLDQAAAVFMRKDPPIDVEYFSSTLILDRVSPRVVMINDPRSLRDCNEKLYALHFPALTPETVISRRPERIREFIAEHGDVVVKPLSGAGGAGVVRLVRGDKNTNSILDLLTLEGRTTVLAQRYLPAVVEGDRRVLLIDGQAVGVINRRARPDDLRSNMHAGGVAEATELSDRDREICAALGPDLVRRGLVFVGIDVIGGWLTEINVTSPTGLQEYARFSGVHLEEPLIDWVEKRSAELRRA